MPDIVATFEHILEDHRIFLVSSLPNHSGGMFLCSLLDEHPQLYTHPYSIHNYIPWKDFETYTLEDHVTRMLDNPILCKMFEVADQTVFCEGLRQIFSRFELNVKNLALAYFTAYHFARKAIPTSHTFVFHTHDWYKTMQYQREFGEGQVIAICRHPANLYAGYCKKYKRSYQGRQLPLPRYQFSTFFREFHQFCTKYHEKMSLVLIEELHGHPEESMKRLCDCMGIDFSESLLKSTQAGVVWNYVGGAGAVSGFSQQHRKVEIDFIGKNAEATIFRMTRHFQVFVGYANQTTLSSADTLRSYLFDKTFFQYYVDCFHSIRELWRSNRSSSEKRSILFKHLIKQIAYYPIHRLFELFVVSRRLMRRDKRGDFSHITMINPLNEDSMEILRK